MKQEENFKKIPEKLRNFETKIEKKLRKFLVNFTLNFGDSLQKTWRISKLISRTFKSKNFKIIE